MLKSVWKVDLTHKHFVVPNETTIRLNDALRASLQNESFLEMLPVIEVLNARHRSRPLQCKRLTSSNLHLIRSSQNGTSHFHPRRGHGDTKPWFILKASLRGGSDAGDLQVS